jgi:hypothetical protein
VAEIQQVYRSIDDYLGPGSQRFFASGFRRARYDVTEVAVLAGDHLAPVPGDPAPGDTMPAETWAGARARIGLSYPSDWSTKADRTDLRPHLSSIDLLVLSAQLCEVHLAHAHCLDSRQRGLAWLRKVSLRAGQLPQEDLLGMSASAVLVSTDPVSGADGLHASVYDCAVGVMRARLEIVHPVAHPAGGQWTYQSMEQALGPAAARYYGDGFKTRRQVITDVAVDLDQLVASATVGVEPIGELAVPGGGIEGQFQPTLTMVDAFVTSLQLGQVLLYELDSVPRERSNTLWMVRTTLESDGPPRPYTGELPVQTAVTRKHLLPMRGGKWRNVDFTSSCGGITIRASFAHELPAGPQAAAQ